MTSVLWFQGGACSGNTMSFINAAEPSVVDLIVDFGLEIVYHPTLSTEKGENAQALFRQYASGEKEVDIFVYEGSVILAPDGTGRYDMFAGPPDEGLDRRDRSQGRHRRRDRRLRDLGRPAGGAAQPERLARAAVRPRRGQGRLPGRRTSPASSASRSSTSPAAPRTRTGSARSSSRSPPAAPATSRSTTCSGRARSSRRSPRPAARGCSSSPTSRTRPASARACAPAACSTSSAAVAP